MSLLEIIRAETRGSLRLALLCDVLGALALLFLFIAMPIVGWVLS